jgi:hypothetical protein
MKRPGMILQTTMLGEQRREFVQAIVDGSKHKQATRKNLEQLISLVGEEALLRHRPVGGYLKNWGVWR